MIDLVVIDSKEHTYKRYHGKTLTNVLHSTEGRLLSAEEIEAFRTQPNEVGEPEVA